MSDSKVGVRVIARFRPPCGKSPTTAIQIVRGNSVVIDRSKIHLSEISDRGSSGDTQQFNFDMVFKPEVSQQDVLSFS